VKVISIPKKFKDLDEYFDKEPENAIDLASNAIDINDFLLAYLYRKYDYSTANGKRKVIDEFRDYYSKIENDILKNHYIKKLAEDLELEEGVVRKTLNTKVEDNYVKKASNDNEVSYINPYKGLENTKEYLFLSLVVKSSLDTAKPIVLKFPNECLSSPVLKELFRKYKVYLQSTGDKINITNFSKDLSLDEKSLLEDLMLYDLKGDFNSIDKVTTELEKLSNFLKEDYKKSRIKDISDQIKKAEKEKNLDQVKILMEELSKFIK